MSQKRGFSAKARNHQWRGNEQLGTRRVVQPGYRPNDALYGDLGDLTLTAPSSWSQPRMLPMAAIGGSALLDAKVHALIDAMAGFAPSAAGQTTPNVWDDWASLGAGLTSPGI